MSKGLEALENIGFEPLYQNEDGSYWRVRDENKEDFDIIEKELKAFEVVRNRIIDIHDFLAFDTYSSFNQRRTLRGLTPIPKEEYDLLKEILL